MTKSSFTFLRVRGIPIGAHWTWSLVFVLLTATLAREVFPQTAPGLSTTAYVAMAAITALLFFSSIVLHELGHAFRALREGMKIDGITLWLFGGIARFLGTFPGPGAELRVAIAGPAVSLLIAASMWAVAQASSTLGMPVAVTAVARYLARINFVLVAFNLVPALPLDGGRVLRAVLWHRQRSFTAATMSASRAGRAFAFVLIGMGIAGLLTRVGAGAAMFAFLGWFLLQAARAEAQYALTLRALDRLTAGDLMTPDPVVVPPETTIAEFLGQVADGGKHSTYPVGTNGRLDGLLAVGRAGNVGPEARESTIVASVMVPRADVPTIERSAGVLEALPALQAGAPAAVVTSGDPERIAGILTIGDIVRGAEAEQARTAASEPPVRPAGLGVWAVVVAAMALCIASIYHPPFVVLSPGPAIDLSRDVTIDGVPAHPVTGRYLLVSIRQTSPSALGLALAGIRSDREIIPLSSVQSIPENQVQVFERSRELAAAAAAKAQGLDVQISGTGARVIQAIRGTPAYGVLRPNDVIVAIDGQPVQQDADVRRIIRARRTGSSFAVGIERDGRRTSVQIRSTRVPGTSPGASAVGVFLDTRDFDIHLPFDVHFRGRPGIGGPSAGLAYALVISDMLSPDDLGRDRTIAATGTVDVQGVVGEIGGIAEKARAAKDRLAHLFIVPAAEAGDVSVPGLAVRGARTLDEALEILRRPT